MPLTCSRCCRIVAIWSGVYVAICSGVISWKKLRWLVNLISGLRGFGLGGDLVNSAPSRSKLAYIVYIR